MEQKLEEVFQQISFHEYTSSKVIAEKIFLSEKTVRQYIKLLNDYLNGHGAKIESKHGFGYRVIVFDDEKFLEFYKDGKFIDNERIPAKSDERIDFILAYLLCHKDYVKLDELCGLLYVSESTLAMDMRHVRERLANYDVRIVSKNKQGIRIAGTEFNLRLCIANYVLKRGVIAESDFSIAEKEKQKISEVVVGTLTKLDISMSEVSIQNLILHLYTTVKRIKNGYAITFPDAVHAEIQSSNSVGLEAARKICEKISFIFQVEFSDYEVDFITIHMFGKRVTEVYEGGISNLVISAEIYDLVGKMLHFVYLTFKIDLQDDFTFKMALAKHLVSLDIRLRYNMNLKNPILKDIKKNYSFGYTVAAQAVIPIEKKYRKKLNEDEIGYFALLFELYMKENDKEGGQSGNLKNILIVCATGKTSAQLLAYQYRKVFGKYLNKISISNTSNLKNENLQDVDYILTTTPISIPVSVPILEIKMFLDDPEINYLKKTFQSENRNILLKYLSKDLFFTGISFQDKEQAIRYLCKKTGQYKSLPEDFYESVLKREELGATDFGEMVAFPHPYGRVTRESFASVCILSKPVYWSNQEVWMIIMISIAEQEDRDLEPFYRQVSEFIMDKNKVKKLLKDQSFDQFLSLMSQEF